MSFLYPTLLWALTAISIPLIIHLFSFRRHKTIYFSQTQFLESVKNDNSSRSKLKQLIILLIRILIIVSLVFAFAQPILTDNVSQPTTNQSKIVSIYIDNSNSMMTDNEKGNLLDIAKQRAIEIAETYNNEYSYVLLSNSMQTSQYQPMTKDAFINACSEITFTSTNQELSKICTTAESILNEYDEIGSKNNIYLISDFQEHTADINKLNKFNKFNFQFLKLQPKTHQNLSIDSVWFNTPYRKNNQAERLFVSIKNHGNATYEDIPVRLTINDSLQALGSVQLKENESSTLEMNYTNKSKGPQRCMIEIDDYPLSFDNQFFFNYTIKEKQNVLVINGNKSHLFPSKLLSDSNEINLNFQDISQINLSEINNYDIIILNAVSNLDEGLQTQLTNYVENLGILWLIPDESANLKQWNKFLSQHKAPILEQWINKKREIQAIDFKHSFFNSVFPSQQENINLPIIEGSWKTKNLTTDLSETLIEFRDNSPLFSLIKQNNKLIYLLTTPIHKNYGNLYKHPLIIPITWNTILNTPNNLPLYYCSNNNSMEIKIDEINSNLNIEISSNDIQVIPTWKSYSKNRIRVFFPKIINKTGHYKITNNDKTIANFAINNIGKESIPNYLTQKEINNIIKNNSINGSVIEEQIINFKENILLSGKGKKLWFWFIATAILLTLIEIFVIRSPWQKN